jgi:hypothetical protein
MGTGFWGLRFSPGSLWRAQRHGSKEIIVARRVPTRSRSTLEVHVTFEPSRVSPACVVQAYEHVVPIARRTPQQALFPRQAECTEQTPRVGRRSSA